MASSTERETFIYVAKLAEQAERYDGLHLFLDLFIILDSKSLSLPVCVCIYIIYIYILIVDLLISRWRRR